MHASDALLLYGGRLLHGSTAGVAPGSEGGGATTCWKPHAYENATVTACLIMYTCTYRHTYTIHMAGSWLASLGGGWGEDPDLGPFDESSSSHHQRTDVPPRSSHIGDLPAYATLEKSTERRVWALRQGWRYLKNLVIILRLSMPLETTRGTVVFCSLSTCAST